MVHGATTSHEITSAISVGCNFTTKSGGVWEISVRIVKAYPTMSPKNSPPVSKARKTQDAWRSLSPLAQLLLQGVGSPGFPWQSLEAPLPQETNQERTCHMAALHRPRYSQCSPSAMS